MIVSNDHRWGKQTKVIKVSYKKCDALPTINVTIGKKHKMRIAFDSGASHFWGQLQKSVDALGGGLTKYIAQAVYEERKISHASHL